MKRDFELVRTILFYLECEDETQKENLFSQIKEQPELKLRKHLEIMEEASFVSTGKHNTAAGRILHPYSRLTWNGYEFLDKIRNDNLWKKIKDNIISKGLSLSFDAISSTATHYMQKMLG